MSGQERNNFFLRIVVGFLLVFVFSFTACDASLLARLIEPENEQGNEPGTVPGNEHGSGNEPGPGTEPGTGNETEPGTVPGSETDVRDISAIISEQLTSCPEGEGTQDNPFNLVIKIDLRNDYENNWEKILAAIKTAGKFVTLDISACPINKMSLDSPDVNDKIIKLTLPDDAQAIEGSSGTVAFKQFPNLKSFTGAGIWSVGDNAFYNCKSLTEVNFPAATFIGNRAFYGCSSLKTAAFPNVSIIDTNAFRNCTGLTEANFLSVTRVSNNAFNGCTNLTETSFPEAVTISQSAFRNCTSLTEVDFPKANMIDQTSFYNCTSLTKISFPSATIIGNEAFRDCTSLEAADFPEVKTINPSSFYNCTNLTKAVFPSATIIGDQAFSGCNKLEIADFPEVVSLYPDIFKDFTRLTEANFPKVKIINHSAFYNCTSLEKVNFPKAETIDQFSFYNCASLKEVSFPSATTIANEAFRNCTGLETAAFYANPPTGTIDLSAPPFINNSVVFYPDSFRGCISLKELDVRNAWNVYFARGSLAEIGEELTLYLYDDTGDKCKYGHPQAEPFMGGRIPEEEEPCGIISLKKLIIKTPTITSGISQIESAGIINFIKSMSHTYYGSIEVKKISLP